MALLAPLLESHAFSKSTVLPRINTMSKANGKLLPWAPPVSLPTCSGSGVILSALVKLPTMTTPFTTTHLTSSTLWQTMWLPSAAVKASTELELLDVAIKNCWSSFLDSGERSLPILGLSLVHQCEDSIYPR